MPGGIILKSPSLVRPGMHPWSPAKLPNLAAWYRASDIRGTAHNATFSTWPDLSGNARDLTVASGGTSATAPTLQMDQWGRGLTVGRFNGTNDRLGAAFTLAKPVHVFALIDVISWVNNKWIWDARTNGVMSLQSVTAANQFRMSGNNSTFSAGVDIGSVPVVISAYYGTGADSEMRVNGGTAAFTSNLGATTTAGFELGGNINAGFAANFDCHEVLLFSAQQATDVRQRIERYLKSKAGLV